MNDERYEAAPDGFRDAAPGPGTAQGEPPRGAGNPGPPAWELDGGGPDRGAGRNSARVMVNVVAVLALVIGLGAALRGPVGRLLHGSQAPQAAAAPAPGQAQAQGAAQAGSAGDVPAGSQSGGDPTTAPLDLRQGGVFVQSNDGSRNRVVAFARAQNGRLREVGRYDTGGTGSATFEDSSNGMVLGTVDGEASPIHIVDKAELLFVVNAGSDQVSVFKVNADGLKLVTTVNSGGEKPVSLTVSHGLLYVLNSGEFDNRLASNPDDGLENCTTGQLASVTGFRVAPDGTLTQIKGSTRLLTGQQISGCAQASFTPDGSTLVVTERIAGKLKPQPPGGTDKGAILTFPVRPDGTLGTMDITDPVGNGPFGFTFSRDGKLLVTEQNGAFDNIGGGEVATYRVTPADSLPDPFLNGPNQALTPVGGSVVTTTTDPCWIVLTGDQRLAFVSSALGTVSALGVGYDGRMTLLHPAATSADGQNQDADRLGFGLTDLGLSHDSRYLYALHSFEGKIYVFLINPNGLLTYVEQHQVFDLAVYPRNEGAPFGIATF